MVPSKHLFRVGKDKALLTYTIVKGYKFNMGKVIENSILESMYHKAITYLSLIMKLCDITRVLIGENEEKFPLMQPLHFPQKKTIHPTRRNIPKRATITRGEREGKE